MRVWNNRCFWYKWNSKTQFRTCMYFTFYIGERKKRIEVQKSTRATVEMTIKTRTRKKKDRGTMAIEHDRWDRNEKGLKKTKIYCGQEKSSDWSECQSTTEEETSERGSQTKRGDEAEGWCKKAHANTQQGKYIRMLELAPQYCFITESLWNEFQWAFNKKMRQYFADFLA